MKKSYNPFNMFGSWIGLLIGAFYSIIALKYFLPDIFDLFLKLGMQNNVVGMGIIKLPFAIVTQGIIGFLLGWGINSLARKLKK